MNHNLLNLLRSILVMHIPLLLLHYALNVIFSKLMEAAIGLSGQ